MENQCGIKENENVLKDGMNNQCDLCLYTFSQPDHLYQHMKKVHNIDLQSNDSFKYYKCRMCDKFLSNISNRRRHEKKLHRFSFKPNFDYRCSECIEVFQFRAQIMEHIVDSHKNFNMEFKNKVFPSREEFYDWKTKIEKDTSTSYLIGQTYNTATYVVQQYNCHRSGILKSKSKGIRRLKLVGSKKTGFFCPSFINIKTFIEKSSVEVSFLFTHMGHDCDMSHVEKSEVAGVSVPSDTCSSVFATVPAVAYSTSFNTVPSVTSSSVFATVPPLINSTGFSTMLLAITYTKDSQSSPKLNNFQNDFNVNQNSMASEEELVKQKERLSQEVRKQQYNPTLKEKAKSALMSFVPKIESFTSDGQFKEIIKTITDLESKCNSLSTTSIQSNPPPFVLRVAPSESSQSQSQSLIVKCRDTE